MSGQNLFSIQSAKSFFDSIVDTRKKYSSENTKNIEHLLYIIMGLNHLREWIAPRYKHTDTPTEPAHYFFNDIYKVPEFIIINSICNRTKHLSTSPHETTVEYSDKLASWNSLNDVKILSNGVPTDYYVDNNNVLSLIDTIISFYDSNWFSQQTP